MQISHGVNNENIDIHGRQEHQNSYTKEVLAQVHSSAVQDWWNEVTTKQRDDHQVSDNLSLGFLPEVLESKPKTDENENTKQDDHRRISRRRFFNRFGDRHQSENKQNSQVHCFESSSSSEAAAVFIIEEGSNEDTEGGEE